ncbi:MAG: response regulator [Spirochaetota bacterium]
MEKHKILVADDILENRKILSLFLSELGFSVIEAENGREALDAVLRDNPDIVILDVMMPEMSGIEVCRVLKSNPNTKIIPVVIITALSDENNHLKAIEAGADDFLSKPFNIHFLRARIKSLLALKLMIDMNNRYQEMLKKSNVELLQKLVSTQEITIFALAKLAEFRDPETGEHLERMREYGKLLALKLKQHPKYSRQISEEFVENLYKSMPLHDIGKVGIPDSILLKPGKLTEEEFEIMKKHTIIGGDALRSAIEIARMERSFLDIGKEIAYHHHERWDGSGYPKGLEGEDIPLSARITAIADVYDALTSKRVYKPEIPHEKACDIILYESRGLFDPDLLSVFGELKVKFREIKMKYRDTGSRMIKGSQD